MMSSSGEYAPWAARDDRQHGQSLADADLIREQRVQFHVYSTGGEAPAMSISVGAQFREQFVLVQDESNAAVYHGEVNVAVAFGRTLCTIVYADSRGHVERVCTLEPHIFHFIVGGGSSELESAATDWVRHEMSRAFEDGMFTQFPSRFYFLAQALFQLNCALKLCDVEDMVFPAMFDDDAIRENPLAPVCAVVVVGYLIERCDAAERGSLWLRDWSKQLMRTFPVEALHYCAEDVCALLTDSTDQAEHSLPQSGGGGRGKKSTSA